MNAIGKFFGWFYGFESLICLGISVFGFRSRLARAHGTVRLGMIGLLACFLALTLVFAMAWWTTRRQMPVARVWGILASLANLAMPLDLIFRFHEPLNSPEWTGMVFGALGLVAYAWPEREEYLSVETLHDDSDPPAIEGAPGPSLSGTGDKD